MKRFLTLLVGLVATSVCYSAPTYTTYFNNTHTYTNSTTAGTNSASRGVFTNSLSAAGFNTSGTTNSTLTGNLLANGATFTNGITLGSSGNLLGGANLVEQRNAANAQTFNVYNTYTDASNYERLSLGFSGSLATLDTASAGTGTARHMSIGTVGSAEIRFKTTATTRWKIQAGGHLMAEADNTYDIGAVGATRPRSVYVAQQVHAGTRLVLTAQTTLVNGGDGVLSLYNAAINDFNRLQFGGTSASFPALKRSSTELQVRLADDSADAPLKSGQLSNTGIRVMTPSSLQTLAAANALLANATKVRVVGSGGAVTLTSTPTIADGSDGQYVMIQGTDDTNTLTVQDQGSLASSNLELGAATRVLGAGDVLVLTFDSTASVWYEVSFANN